MENIFFSILMAIFLAVGLSILVLFPAYHQARKAEKKETETSNAAAVKTARKFTIEEVAKHNAESDCWLIIKNKVYDVSSYVNDHPGGEAILNNAGGENTKGFYGFFRRHIRYPNFHGFGVHFPGDEGGEGIVNNPSSVELLVHIGDILSYRTNG